MAISLLTQTRFRRLFFIVWIIWIALHTLVLRSFGASWHAAFTDSILTNGLLLLACLLLMNTLRFYVPQSNRYLLLVGWTSVLSLIWLFGSRFLLQLFLEANAFQTLVQPTLFIRFSIGYLILGNLVLVCVIWYNWQEQKSLEAHRAETDKLSRDAELYKLHQQLQPHFLFNSLNSINALIVSKPAQARTMVLQLSDFLRSTLKKEEQQWVPLQEELDYLQLYLDIEKVRFGHRLSTAFDVREEAKNLLLPVLLLQPIVENAIKFGLYDTLDDICITLTAKVAEDKLIISVQNPFDPETTQPSGTGFGLSSIRRRLYLLFGRNDLLTTSIAVNIFAATLFIPQTTGQHERSNY